jgi:hypothetical protein
VGPVDAAAVETTFLDSIGSGSGAEKIMQLAWREARLLRVDRQPPLVTALGKILHLHRGPGTSGPPV